ncbi:MAG: PhnA protein [Marivirga sp.]|nr:PhnA protein [Marivirga sp.]
MNIEKILMERSGAVCELCGSNGKLQVYDVPPVSRGADGSVLICSTCIEQLSGTETLNVNHWHCLNSSMWSSVPVVQVVVWRLLNALRHEGWPQDLLDMLYLDDDTLAWAKATALGDDIVAEEKIIHKDSNGTVLQSGDSVVLIKDLDVKGGGFTAKRGTAVRGISLVENNPGQIEGRVSGQVIVILTQFVRKSV